MPRYENQSEKRWPSWVYKIGFWVILVLPILSFPPVFFPPDWAKTIIFRSILAIIAFIFVSQLGSRGGIDKLQWITLKKSKIAWFLVGLFIIYLLASIFSPDSYFSFWGSPYRSGGLVTFGFYFLFALLVFFIFKENDWKKLWDISIFAGILVALIAVIQHLGLLNKIFLSAPDRPSSTMGNPILLAAYLLILFFMSLFFAVNQPFSSTKDKTKKIFYIVSGLLFLYVVLITGARGAYLGFLIGVVFFLFFYPKKLPILKISSLVLLALVVTSVLYINYGKALPKFFEENKIFQAIKPRLSIDLVLTDPRFYAWSGIDLKAISEKPILGWGIENFSIAFDRYYDPSIPFLSKEWGNWWDRAHNNLIQTAIDAGLLGLIFYLGLFVMLFLELRKLKIRSQDIRLRAQAHGLQATLVAYFSANLFSFDSFASYLILFLIIGYALHLSRLTIDSTASSSPASSYSKWRKPVIVFAFVALIIFLWRYNLTPFYINAQINESEVLANKGLCDQSFKKMDDILKSRSFLDSYARIQYVEFTITCNKFYPENNLAYVKKGMTAVSEAIKIQPFYTRYWISMAAYKTGLASKETNESAKVALLEDAKYYINKSLELSPKHQETIIERAKMNMVAKSYDKALADTNECIELHAGLSDCYFYRALSNIYLKNAKEAEIDLKTAREKLYSVDSKESLDQLVDAYGSIPDYKNLSEVFKKLIALNPAISQYHSSLAFFYRELGEHEKAREEAMIVLELSPESKPNVDAFLKTLP